VDAFRRDIARPLFSPPVDRTQRWVLISRDNASLPEDAMSASRIIFRAFAIVALLALAATAQHQPTSGDVACGAPGFGEVHHPVKTGSPAAQHMFNQGLALDYGFNHNQAEKCFQRAAELDPKMAMAYWGIALVVGPNYNLPIDAEREHQAYEAIQKARQLAANGPPAERAYIEALSKRYSSESTANYHQLDLDYNNAMRELVKQYPDDLDAATLFAESGMNLRPWLLWDHDGNPEPGTQEIVATLESVLRRDPNHIGANHFYIHAVEASSQPERALPSAERLAGLAPASGHLVHMPGHIFIRAGYHDAAAKTNVAAVAADDSYFKANHPQGIYPMMYYTHNLHFIVMENATMGRFADSLAAARHVQEHVGPHVKEMAMLDGFYPMPTLVLVRFRRWNDILQLQQPDAAMPVSSGVWHYARGLALADAGKLDQAQAEVDAVQKLAPEMAKVPIGPHPKNAAINPQIAMHVVEARIAWAKGQKDAAIDHLREAVRLQDSMEYTEPPDWFYPVRESLGGLLLQAGKASEAEKTFREDLERNPRNPRSLFGLMESLKAQGKIEDAGMVQQQFESVWKNADTKLKIADL
jgi:tetratricopeptide (TPR) repeat protein